jgi:HicB family
MAPAQTRGATAEAHPEKDSSHSGRLLLRMPPALHAELARAAERDGISLNAFITRALAGSQEPDPPPQAAPEPDRGSRLLRIAVIADLVLVAVAAIVAVTLLLVAWP